FPRPHHQVFALRRQRAQELLRMLVGAVLGPHEGEDGQLEVVRLSADPLADQLVLAVCEAQLAVACLGGLGGHAAIPAACAACAADAKSSPPSVEPVSGSTACSACGISPTTFRASLHTPAMSSI